jgi:hypothetical protein
MLKIMTSREGSAVLMTGDPAEVVEYSRKLSEWLRRHLT